MRWTRENILSTCLLLLVLIANAVALWPEVAISRVNLNDSVLHYTLVERVVQAVEHGENPLDCWSAEWALGFPVLRVYQPLAHLVVAASWFALAKAVPLLTLFTVERFLWIALLPLSFFAAARLMGLSHLTAAAAAILAPLVSTNYLFGVEYGSFTWFGTGLFPQAVATHFLLLALGFGFVAVRSGRRVIVAGVMVALSLLSHLIYGYMAALSLLLLVALPDAESPRLTRLRRVLSIGGVAFLLSAFQLLPLVHDAGLISHSRWEPLWKWDSFGAWQVIRWLFTGELLDYDRLPVLTVLALAGAALYFRPAGKLKHAPPKAANHLVGHALACPVTDCWRRTPVHAFLAAGAAFWIAIFFGRPFWGPLLDVLGASPDMHLHRVIGGAQVFLVFLAAVALDEAWRMLPGRRAAFAFAATALLLYPAVRERAGNLTKNAYWGRNNLDAYTAAAHDLDGAIADAGRHGGRAYAGLAATWGANFKIGSVPVYAFLSTAQVPTVGFLYHSMALAGDVMVRFNDVSPEQYRLWNIRTVIAPANMTLGPPGMLQPRQRFGSLQTFDAPGGGYFDLVDVAAAVKTDRRNFFDVNNRWLESGWPAQRAHLLLDWDGSVPPDAPRLAPDAALPALPSSPPPAGTVISEAQDGQVYRAELAVWRPSYALFKMGWHPDWHAYVDGVRQPSPMLSPGYAGVRLPPGRHRVEFRYEPGLPKPLLALAGILAVLLLSLLPAGGAGAFACQHARWMPFQESRVTVSAALARLRIPLPKPVLVGAGLLLLALPVCIRLFTGSLLVGHDSYGYFPRVVELHQNLVNGIALPRWAPDLGSGYGQPLFIFHPPFFYWVAELWRLLGWNYVTAVNLACALLVVASALTMFLLARLYFGDVGGWLGAAAYLYVPYFAVDLYVRSAFEEFSLFPLVPLALYGFGTFAKRGSRGHWVLGAAAYALMLFCHFPAALLFSPLLAGFLAVTAWREKSWHVLAEQAAGMAFGLGLGACTWLPAFTERPYVSLARALQGHGDFATHFVVPYQLFFSPWGYGYSVKGPDDGMSFALGWSHVLLAVAASIWVARRPKLGDWRLMRFFAIAGTLLCFLMLEDAAWLWEHVSLLPYVQFPWRLLGPAALCSAMLVAALGPAISNLRRHRWLAFGAALALLVIPNLPHLQPDRTAVIDPAFWTPHQLAVTGFETTTAGEMTPRWMELSPSYTPVAAVVAAGDAQIRDERRTGFHYTGQVIAKAGSRIRVSEAWFPGWTLRIDGRPAEAGPAPGSGLVEFTVPAGIHDVELTFGRSPARRLGESISLLFLAILALYIRLRRPRPVSAPAAAARAAAASQSRS
jgi:Dolichyl-phosphate-mannose-protein mannosyltransferase